jgi:hypothetical protein
MKAEFISKKETLRIHLDPNMMDLLEWSCGRSAWCHNKLTLSALSKGLPIGGLNLVKGLLVKIPLRESFSQME